MPKRSTPFQRLVRHIQEQVTPNAVVTESAMLRHSRLETDVEVDVVIRSRIGEHDLIISIECLEQRRRADRNWVEQQKAKHDELPTNKLVLVSLSGFTKSAIRLAEAYGIDRYTPESALDANWTRIAGKLSQVFIASYQFSPTDCELVIATDEGEKAIPAGMDTRIETSEGVASGTLKEVVMQALRSPKPFGQYAMDKFDEHRKDGKSTLDCAFTITPHPLAVDNEGRRHAVISFKIKANAVKATTPVNLSALSWKGVPVAFGSATTPLGKSTVTVIEQDENVRSVKLSVDGQNVTLHPPSA